MKKHAETKRPVRLLAFLLSLTLVLTAMPSWALAEDTQGGWNNAFQQATLEQANDQVENGDFLFTGYALPPDTQGDPFPSGTLSVLKETTGEDGEPSVHDYVITLPVGEYTVSFPSAVDNLNISDVTLNQQPVADPSAVTFSIAADETIPLSYKLAAPIIDTADSLDPFISKITLSSNGQTIVITPDADPAILENVKNGDAVQVTYAFAIPDPSQSGFQTDVPYAITIPKKGFNYSLGQTEIEVSAYDAPVGTFVIDPDNATATLTFTNADFENSINYSGSFTFTGSLSLSGDGENNDLQFTVGGKPITVPVKPEEKPSPVAKVEKAVEGGDNYQNRFPKWTITVTPPEGEALPSGLIIDDIMRNAVNNAPGDIKAHELAPEGIYRVKLNDVVLTENTDYKLTFPDGDGDRSHMQIQLLKTDCKPGEKLVIVYRSRLTADGYADALAKGKVWMDGSNSATLDGKPASKAEYPLANHVSVSYNNTPWGEATRIFFNFSVEPIIKTGSSSVGTNTIKWSVLLNINFMHMPAGVTLEDLLPEGLAYVDGSLKVFGYNKKNAIKDPANYTIALKAADYFNVTSSSGIVSFTLKQAIDEPLLLTFETTGKTNTGYQNTARLNWLGHTITVSTGTITNPHAGISKYGALSKSNRTAQWTITVGKTSGPATVVDYLAPITSISKEAQTGFFTLIAEAEKHNPLIAQLFASDPELSKIYIERLDGNNKVVKSSITELTLGGKPVKLTSEKQTSVSLTYDAASEQLSAYFDGPLEHYYRLRFWTYIDGEVKQGQSANTTTPILSPSNASFTNKSSLHMEGKPDLDASALVRFEGALLTKNGKANNDGTVLWTLNINAREVPIYNASISDVLELPEYLELDIPAGAPIGDAFKLSNNSTPKEPIRYTVTQQENGKYQITFLNKIASSFKIQIRMRLTEKAQAVLNSGAQLNLKNTATLTGSEFPDGSGQIVEHTDKTPVTASATVTYTNVPVEKQEPVFDKNTNTVNWSVIINKNHIPLENVSNVHVIDQFTVSDATQGIDASDLVDLDLDSVRLYRATNDKNTAWTEVTPAPVFAADGEEPASGNYFTYDQTTKKFTFHLDPGADGKWSDAYKLTYGTAIAVPSDYQGSALQIDNKVTWLGEKTSEKKFSIEISKLSGQIDYTKLGSVSITKLAADADGNKTEKTLSGATFWLYDDETNKPIMSGSTDKNGNLTFKRLTVGKTYSIVETKAPAGYVKSPGQIKFFVGSSVQDGGIVEVNVYNTKIQGGIQLYKYASGTFDPKQQSPADSTTAVWLNGAEFALYNSDGELVKTAVTEDIETEYGTQKGSLIFENLDYGVYTLEETKAPEGYELPADASARKFTVNVTKNNTIYPVYAENTAIPVGSIEIVKTDASSPETALENAKFALFRNDEETAFREFPATDIYGKTLLTDLPLGSYTIKEIEAPEGYYLSSDAIPVSITEDGQRISLPLTNEPVPHKADKGSIEVYKYDAETQKPLAGAEFTLYNDAGEPFGAPKVSDETGVVTFSGIPLIEGVVYTLRETAAPAGYQLSDRVIPVRLEDIASTETAYRVEMPNEPVLGKVIVTKVSEADENGLQTILPGAKFELLGDDQQTVVREALTTGETGQLTFENLHLGMHYLRETEAPAGYVLSSTLYPVDITAENARLGLFVTVTNTRATVEVPDEPTPEGPPDEETPDDETPDIETPDTEIPDTNTPTGGRDHSSNDNPDRRPIIVTNTANRTPEEIEVLIDEGYVPLGAAPDLPVEEIIENDIPLAFFPPDEPVPTGAAQPEIITLEADQAPKTGDTAPIGILFALLAISAGGFIFLGKKHN